MKRSNIPTKAVLTACELFHTKNGQSPWKTLVKEFNAPEKVVYSAMERDFDKDLIEYGVSLRTAWVTDKGYIFLNDLP